MDEAGDEGFGKLKHGGPTGQSSWLVIGALVVDEAGEIAVPKWRNAIHARFPNKKRPDLHFSTLNHEQKVVVCQEIAKLPVAVALTLSHKITIPDSSIEKVFKQKGYLYNYLVRWLLERLITLCRAHAGAEGARLKVVFSRRAGTNYESMKAYLRMLAGDRDLVKAPRKTDWSVLDIDGIEVENHSKRAGLQLADCTTSAFFSAIEKDLYGNYTDRYALILRSRLARLGGVVTNVGLTVVPSIHASRCDDHHRAFFRACQESGQAPGS